MIDSYFERGLEEGIEKLSKKSNQKVSSFFTEVSHFYYLKIIYENLCQPVDIFTEI